MSEKFEDDQLEQILVYRKANRNPVARSLTQPRNRSKVEQPKRGKGSYRRNDEWEE